MILMIYQRDTFREYVLPNVSNQDYPVVLDNSQFHLGENIVLDLENLNNQWMLHSTSDYKMNINHLDIDDCVLEDQTVIYFNTEKGETFQGIVADVEESFQVFKKYDISGMNFISIGKEDTSIIQYEFRDLISKNHCIIQKNGDGFILEDRSTNGVFLNSVRINGSVRLKFGEVINIFGLHIVYLNGVIAVGSSYGKIKVDESHLQEFRFTSDIDTSTEAKDEKIEYFNRSPRNTPNINRDEIEIEPPPQPKLMKKKPLIFTIGPSFTMAIPMMLGCLLSIYGAKTSGRTPGVYMFTGIVTAVGSAIFGVIWAIANLKYAAKEETEDEQIRFDSYGNYLLETANTIRTKYEENTISMHSMYPSSKECAGYGRSSQILWNRNFSHEDFYFFRLGLGDVPFQVDIKITKEKFTLIQDSLKKKPGMLLDEYQMLHNVPVGIDISAHRLYGIVGGKNGALQIMYNIVAQIAANVCYTDIKMAFVYDEKSVKDKEQWTFAKWLPHVWSEDKKTRYFANNELEAKELFYELSNVIRHRSEDEEVKKKGFRPKPHYVLFIANPSFLEGELLKKYVYEPQDEYGLTTFIMTSTFEQLPNECENIIEHDQYFDGIYNTMDTSGNRQIIKFDELDTDTLTEMAKRLSGIKVKELESNSDIPNTLDFFEMYGVKSLKDFNVIERWRKNRTFNTMKALIGKKAGGSDCYLDIHEKYHGPHGLIAGTTGSGKSETLQTYMLSLAINYSPDDIGFFVIDFKGGGMANLFSNLPHMIGQISNLSGNQVRRAMISIKSENMRRQRLFSEYGVNNINLYTRLYKDNETTIPIPHLFIIIDEFAELKREEPDFMRELISVAQVGRSLGVHLILATQKPSGTVDDNIWSNSKFRLCLRVQDRQDSNDMLHKPDAAYITQAGRCYLQVGNDEIYELFQSGWSGAVYDENSGELNQDIATMLTSTGKAAVVGSRAKIKHKEQEKKKYYKSIVNIIMSEMLEHRLNNDINQIEENRLDEFAVCVIEQMNNEGIDYETNNANIKKIVNFLKLWPNGNMSIDEIVDYISEQSKIRNIRLPDMKEKTQLDAIVEYLGGLAKENGYNHNLQLWLPVLPREIYITDLIEVEVYKNEYFNGEKWNCSNSEWKIEIPVGLYDDPENQSQAPVYIDFSQTGHLAVCGTILSGKSTFLQSVIYTLSMRYTPDYVNIYALDFSSKSLLSFQNMPQVGGVLHENDLDGIEKMFNMFESILEERKKILGGGNYAQYVKAYGVKFPAIFLIIDNYSNFSEKTDGKYSSIMMTLAREGVGYGIYLVLSSAGFGMAEIPNRIGDNIRNVICLEMGDKFKYMDVLHVTHINVLPENDIKGRGLVSVNGTILEFQTVLPVEADDDYKRGQKITELGKTMSASWTGRMAKKIPRIPENPILSEFNKLDEVKDEHDKTWSIPYAYYQKNAAICSVDLRNTYCFMINGKAKTGKTNLLKGMIEQSSRKECELMIYEKDGKELEKMALEYGADYISDDKKLFQYFEKLLPEFVKRNKLKQQLLAEGNSDNELYQKMSENKPIFIFISDMKTFIKSIYKPESGIGNMSGFFENIIAKGELHNIYFFGVITVEDVVTLNTYQAFRIFTEYKTGVHLGGYTAAQRIFQFQDIPFADLNKPLKKGIGLIPSGEDGTESEKIVIPVYGR